MNQYQRSEKQSSSTMISLVILLLIAAAVCFYLYRKGILSIRI